MPVRIEIEGLKELRERFAKWPRKYQGAVEKTITASLLTFWENVPPYPKKRPYSNYRRTGTLGRSLGSGEGGGKSGGAPDIYAVRMGPKMSTGEFGSRLNYAPRVIGDERGQQDPFFKERGWWTLPQTVVTKSMAKITRLWQIMAEELARWLDENR